MSKRNTKTKKKSGRRIRVKLLVFLILLIGAGAFWLWLRIEAEPEWWQPPDTKDENVVELGHETESWVMSVVTRKREEDKLWRFRMKDESLNAWLVVNLPNWVLHETGEVWPENISMPQVRSEKDGFNTGICVEEVFDNRVVSLKLVPTFSEEGMRLQLDQIALGRLTLPLASAGSLISSLRDTFLEEVDEQHVDTVIDLLTGETLIDPVFELSDGRIVRIHDIILEEGSVVLVCSTMREDSGN